MGKNSTSIILNWRGPAMFTKPRLGPFGPLGPSPHCPLPTCHKPVRVLGTNRLGLRLDYKGYLCLIHRSGVLHKFAHAQVTLTGVCAIGG